MCRIPGSLPGHEKLCRAGRVVDWLRRQLGGDWAGSPREPSPSSGQWALSGQCWGSPSLGTGPGMVEVLKDKVWGEAVLDCMFRAIL